MYVLPVLDGPEMIFSPGLNTTDAALWVGLVNRSSFMINPNFNASPFEMHNLLLRF